MEFQDARFAVVLNKSYEIGQMLSAIGHVTAGLAGSFQDASSLRLVTYEDASGDEYPFISHWPFLIMRASGGQLKSLRAGLRDDGLPCVTYLDTMFSGGSDAQQDATRARKSDDIAIVALGTFGERSSLDPHTRKLSLWR